MGDIKGKKGALKSFVGGMDYTTTRGKRKQKKIERTSGAEAEFGVGKNELWFEGGAREGEQTNKPPETDGKNHN